MVEAGSRKNKKLNTSRQHLLDHDTPSRPCSRIWQLCKKAILFLQDNISKVPHGGSSINIWHDKIMGKKALSVDHSLLALQQYHKDQGIHTLNQISS